MDKNENVENDNTDGPCVKLNVSDLPNMESDISSISNIDKCGPNLVNGKSPVPEIDIPYSDYNNEDQTVHSREQTQNLEPTINNDPYDINLSDIERDQITVPNDNHKLTIPDIENETISVPKTDKLSIPDIENKTISMPKTEDNKVIIPRNNKKLTIPNTESKTLLKPDTETIPIPTTTDQKVVSPNMDNNSNNLFKSNFENEKLTISDSPNIDNNNKQLSTPNTDAFTLIIPEMDNQHLSFPVSENLPTISHLENQQAALTNKDENQHNGMPNEVNIQSNIQNLANNQQPDMLHEETLQVNIPQNDRNHSLNLPMVGVQRRYSENISSGMNNNNNLMSRMMSGKQNKPYQLRALKEASDREDTNEVLWGFRMKEFLSTEWSVVGVSYILKRGVFWLRRLIWLLLVLFGFGFMVYQIRDRAMYYLSNPTQVNIALSYKKMLPFPTVTVCSENLLDRNRSMYQYILPNGLPALLQHIYPPMPASDFKPNFTVIQELSGILEHNNITWKFFWESLSPFQNKRHLVHCEYDGQVCGKANLSLVTTDMGYCLQFNGDGFDYQTSRPGLSAGLVLTVNARQIDFVYTKSIGSGLRVLLHNKADVPHVQNYGFRVSTGFVSSAPFRLQTMTRLPLPYAVENCTSDPNYSYKGCVDKCRHTRVIEACGCRFFYYQGSNISTCNPQQMYQCADIELAEYPNNHVTAKLCGCLAQCSTDHYLYSLSQSVMSDFAVSQMALQQRTIKCQNDSLCTSQFDLEGFETVIRRDWAQIQVYFSDLIHEEIVTSPAYPLLQLLCDIGGALGLILGATILSFCEMIDFVIVVFYDWIVFQIGNRKDKRRNSIQ